VIGIETRTNKNWLASSLYCLVTVCGSAICEKYRMKSIIYFTQMSNQDYYRQGVVISWYYSGENFKHYVRKMVSYVAMAFD